MSLYNDLVSTIKEFRFVEWQIDCVENRGWESGLGYDCTGKMA